jgi:hypothetical protein
MDQDQWRKLYRDVVIETNFDTIVGRIRAARNAIARRLSLNGDVTAEERRELHHSMDALFDLSGERTRARSSSDGNE